VAGGAGAQVDEAGSAGVAMVAAPTDGDRAASVEGASGPDAGPATANRYVLGTGWCRFHPIGLCGSGLQRVIPGEGRFGYLLALGAGQRRRWTAKQSCYQYFNETT
jgi:hypothetical protein